MPARPLHALWARRDAPPLEWFIGATDVVHGTNFVVPPTGRAAAVVSVHDLTPLHHPELCNEATLAYPGLIRRALRPGRLGPHRLGVRGRRGGGGLRRRPRPASASSTPAFPTCRSPPTRMPRRCCGGSSRPASGGSAWPSGRPSRARTCPGWCAPSARWPTATPTWRSSWPARPAGARRRWTAAVAVLAGPGQDRAHGLGRGSPTWPRCCPGPACWPTPRSTRGSASRRCRPCGPGCRWWRPGPARCPRCSATAPLLVEPGDHDGLVDGARPLPGRRGAARAASLPRARRGRPAYSWERCGDGLEALYRDAAAGAWLSGAPPSVLLAVEQLRRRVPGGIGAYARGLLGGLAAVAAEGDGGRRDAPGQPAARRRRPTRWPRSAGRCTRRRLPGRLLTRAWDHGLSRAPDGFDVVHSVSLAAPRLRRSSAERLVVTVHDVAWRRHPEATTRRGAALARGGAAAGHAVGRRARRPVPAGGGRPGWPTGVDDGPAHGRAERRRSSAGARRRRQPMPLLRRLGVAGEFLLTVGTLEPRKNVDRLVQAFGRCATRSPARGRS